MILRTCLEHYLTIVCLILVPTNRKCGQEKQEWLGGIAL